MDMHSGTGNGEAKDTKETKKKKPYTTPALKVLGTVSALTGGATGSVTDGGSTKQVLLP